MIPYLADATVLTADALASWISALMYLGGFACTILAGAVALKKLREPAMPQPMVVKAHDQFVLQGDVDQIHGRIKRERMEIDAALQALREEDLRLREKLDDEISNLQERIDAVPSRVISLLRETKGLI